MTRTRRRLLEGYRTALKATVVNLESVAEEMERVLRRARETLERLEIELDGD